jgi:transcription elongation GreA/GreB family factor
MLRIAGHCDTRARPLRERQLPVNHRRGTPPGPLSAPTRQRLERELAELRARYRALNEAVFDTDGTEDRADQAQRLEAADDLARLADRIHEITDLLRGRATPSAVDALPEGTQVTIRFRDGSTDTMLVTAVPDDSPETLTRNSPLGRALARAQPGGTITYPGPNGMITAEVIAIQPPRP